MNTDNHTEDRIVLAALTLYLANGIKKTSTEEVAEYAGVTRVTVYRYFANKRDLVRAAFQRSEMVFERARLALRDDPTVDPIDVLRQIGQGLAALPMGDLAARLDEMARLYPDVYDEFQQARLATQGELFDRLFALADAQHLVRPDLNRTVARAVIHEVLVNVLRSPHLTGLGLTNLELFSAVSDLMLYGILVSD